MNSIAKRTIFVHWLVVLWMLLPQGMLHSQDWPVLTSADLVNWVENQITQFPGSDGDDYVPPSPQQLGQWTQVLTALIEADYPAVDSLSNLLGYQLLELEDSFSHKNYFILQRSNTSDHHWGAYIFNPDACRSQLVIQAPHPLFDEQTGVEGAYVFRETDALLFCLAGTHRCNSHSYTACDGSTSACGNQSQPYRLSDMAHAVQTIFQQTTLFVETKFPNRYFVQLHGFAKRPDDPFVLLSNASFQQPETEDLLTQFGSLLLQQDSMLSFAVAHIDNVRLPGTTNTQGRLINGSADPCQVISSRNEGRFFHIEQERSRLRATKIGWEKVSQALRKLFPASNCAPPIDTIVPWNYQETEESHTVLFIQGVKEEDASSLEQGDYIGFFFPSESGWNNAGYGKWQGKPLAISVWGDDPLTPAKEGFAPGEKFQIRIWRPGLQKDISVSAKYTAPDADTIATHTDHFAAEGISIITSILGATVQELVFNPGWNLVSSYVAPTFNDLQTLFADHIEDLILMKNGVGTVFIPSLGISALQKWEVGQGYQIKARKAFALPLIGQKIPPADTPVPLRVGWNMVAYLCDRSAPVSSTLENIIPQLLIIKEGNGLVFIPSLQIDQLKWLAPGKGYKIKMANEDVLYYRCDDH